MSSILKAIRKIEDEKRSGEHESPNLMVDHGRSENTRSRSSLLMLSFGILVGGVVAGFFVWGMQLGTDDAHDALKSTLADKPDTNPVAQKIESHLPGDDRATSPESDALDDSQRLPTREPAQDNIVETVIIDGKQPSSAVNNSLAKPVDETLPSLPAGINLEVSEIYYSDQSSDSMAVVNDLPVMVGTHIDSAVVTAIHADRVDFLVDGKAYSVRVVPP